MTPDFWSDGASLRIYAAHEAELPGFTAKYGLKRADALGQIRHFKHESVDLEVYVNSQSGPSIALMCGLSLAESQPHTRHLLLGASGHSELTLAAWYHPSTLRLDVVGSPRILYPSLMGCDAFGSTEHLTRTAVILDYPAAGGVDLESYYWFQAMARQVSQESLGILRFVSDNPSNSLASANDARGAKKVAVEAWESSHSEIEKWLSFHSKRSAVQAERHPSISMPESLARFRWSRTQELELTRLLERVSVLAIDLDPWIQRVGAHIRSRKDLLKALHAFVDSHEVHLHG